MKLSDDLLSYFDDQITLELSASTVYRQLAIELDFQDLPGMAAWLRHQVIFFREQSLDSEGFMRFARTMGSPVEYPFVKGLPGFPEIIEVKKLEHERVNFGGLWHTDTSYLEQPPSGTMLLAREVPPYGGDTLFSSQCLAFEHLSDEMQRMLDAGLDPEAEAEEPDVDEGGLSAAPEDAQA